MARHIVSFTAQSWHDQVTGALSLRLCDVEEGAGIALADGHFLLRVTAEEHEMLYRCYVRHIATGREIALQSGSDLRAFVADCVLRAIEAASDDA